MLKTHDTRENRHDHDQGVELAVGSGVCAESASLSRAHPDDPAQHDFGNDGSCLYNTLLFVVVVSPDSKLAQATSMTLEIRRLAS